MQNVLEWYGNVIQHIGSRAGAGVGDWEWGGWGGAARQEGGQS